MTVKEIIHEEFRRSDLHFEVHIYRDGSRRLPQLSLWKYVIIVRRRRREDERKEEKESLGERRKKEEKGGPRFDQERESACVCVRETTSIGN